MKEALGRRPPAGTEGFLLLLERRLGGLHAIAAGLPWKNEAGSQAEDRTLARRFLEPREASWHDGDENLVRGYLDTWVPAGGDPRRAAARGLLSAANALSGMRPRPETLWCYLWHLESQLPSLLGHD